MKTLVLERVCIGLIACTQLVPLGVQVEWTCPLSRQPTLQNQPTKLFATATKVIAVQSGQAHIAHWVNRNHFNTSSDHPLAPHPSTLATAAATPIGPSSARPHPSSSTSLSLQPYPSTLPLQRAVLLRVHVTSPLAPPPAATTPLGFRTRIRRLVFQAFSFSHEAQPTRIWCQLLRLDWECQFLSIPFVLLVFGTNIFFVLFARQAAKKKLVFWVDSIP